MYCFYVPGNQGEPVLLCFRQSVMYCFYVAGNQGEPVLLPVCVFQAIWENQYYYLFVCFRQSGRTSITTCLCVSGNLGEPVLLSVWISVPGIYHPGDLLLTNLHCHGVLSVVWGGENIFT